MAVTILNRKDRKISGAQTDGTYTSFNAPAGTKLLVAEIFVEGLEAVDETTSPPGVYWNTTEGMTLISTSTVQSANSRVRSYLFAILNPTADITADVTIPFESACNPAWTMVVAYGGDVDTASLAAAIEVLEELFADTVGQVNTYAFASAGASGNLGVLAIASQGGPDKSPIEDNASFVDVESGIFNTTTGGSGTSDFAVRHAEKQLTGAQAVTINYPQDPDQTPFMSGFYYQVKAASGIDGDGTPAAQAATASGAGARVVTGTGLAASDPATAAGTGARGAVGTGTITAQAATVSGDGSIVPVVQVILTAANSRELRDQNNALVANLANIVWEWYDDPTSTAGEPIDSGTTSTDANGEATINVQNSALTNGQFGQLVLYHPTDAAIRGVYRVPVSD